MSSTQQQQQQQVIVKAYYNDLIEKQPEIRRFAIDISSDKDVYQTLETTIAQLNGDYPQGQFTLQYVDEDNDRITFSSNGEFRSALNNISAGGMIKIFVKPKVKQSSQNTNVVHPYVTCDGCQGPVIGNRFKCMECPNYDLCQTCSDKNLHSEHNMLKFTRPSQRSFGGHRRCGRGPFGGGRRFWHHFMRQQGGPAGFPMPSDMTNFLGQFKGKELAELIETHVPEFLRTEKLTEVLSQFKTGEHADKPVDETILLENVGQFLRETLSSFGINCDYSVDKQTEESKPTEKKEESATTAGDNNTSTESKPTASSASASASNNIPPLGNLLEQFQTVFAPMFQPPTAAGNNTSSEPKPTASSASASASNNIPPLGNLLEQFQTVFAPMFQPPTTTTATSADAQQTKQQKKIDECIERMTSMGFVDSNGILTELIKSKKGDLEQVLDALNPRNYKD